MYFKPIAFNHNVWLLHQASKSQFLFCNFSAVAVAFDVHKFQFAKTLLEKQPTASKLLVGVTDDGGNLLHAFAKSCKDPQAVDQELIVELVGQIPSQDPIL